MAFPGRTHLLFMLGNKDWILNMKLVSALSFHINYQQNYIYTVAAIISEMFKLTRFFSEYNPVVLIVINL